MKRSPTPRRALAWLRVLSTLLVLSALMSLTACAAAPPQPETPVSPAEEPRPEEPAGASQGVPDPEMSPGEEPPPAQPESPSSREAPPDREESGAPETVPDQPEASTIQAEQTPQSDLPPAAGELRTYVYSPVAAGSVVVGNAYVDIDVSNAAEGYCHVRYTGGGSARIKVLITKDGGTQYQYNLNTGGDYEVFPFSAGSGAYTVGVYQNVGGSSYATLYSTRVEVTLRAATLPFLYANQQVDFWGGSATVAKGAELSQAAQNDLAKVSGIYNYVLDNLQYDYDKAATVQSGYIPAVDSILASGYGICFDYAAVMAAMLRTQNIPTKVVVGYAGDVYHAWISTYITDVGWVNSLVYFDGQSWRRMDPTFADNGGQSRQIMDFINTGGNYHPVYFY